MTFANFLTDFENIGKHIISGIEKAAPIVAKFAAPVSMIPLVGPPLAEAATIITALEQQGTSITPDDLAAIIQTIASASHIKNSALAGAAASTIKAQ